MRSGQAKALNEKENVKPTCRSVTTARQGLIEVIHSREASSAASASARAGRDEMAI